MAIRHLVRLLTAALTACVPMTGTAAAQGAADCRMAGTSVRVQAEESAARPQTFTYVVVNDRHERLRRVRIGSGGSWHTEVLPQQRLQIVMTPDRWRGDIVYPTETNQAYMSWEAAEEASALAPKSRTAFGIAVAGPPVRPNQVGPDGLLVKQISFEYRPFTVYSDSGCWWGWTSSSHAGTPVGGYFAGTVGASVRSFADAGRDYVIVDAPSFDTQLRVSDKQVFATVPLTMSWGVKGGFSHNASIGIGLRWSPVEHVSVYAQTHLGTFFFTNRTHLRHVGVDINIPCYSISSMGTISRNKYLVFGVEYFDRSVVKWAGFMEGPQWYASGRGIAIRFGVRRIAWTA